MVNEKAIGVLNEVLGKYRERYPTAKEKIVELISYAGRLEFKAILTTNETINKTKMEVLDYMNGKQLHQALNIITTSWMIRMGGSIDNDELYEIAARTLGVMNSPLEPTLSVDTMKSGFRTHPMFYVLFLMYYGLTS